MNLTYSQLSYGLPKAVSIYQNGLLFVDLRANYREYPVFLNDYYDLTIFVIKAVLDYFLAPHLYQITTISDLVALFENLSRIMIILLICYRLYTNKINLSELTFIIFFFFCIIEIIWAMGTSNWGSAIRHHSVALPILFISLAVVLKKN